MVRAVPEPGTWALMVAGFGLTGVSLRRRTGLRTVAA
ncbi:PEPxxWA-CTERM sorting domain-containing protein [Sphingosinicellaceae bacterium]|nr:PEPxxWA-CTERM sorting domain-containing protein [Sphingosinicellaceae bacterium]